MAAAAKKLPPRGADGKFVPETKADDLDLEIKDANGDDGKVTVSDGPSGQIGELKSLIEAVERLESKSAEVSQERHDQKFETGKEDPLTEQKHDRVIADLMARVDELKAQYQALEVKGQRPGHGGSDRMDDDGGDYFDTKSDDEFGIEVKSAWAHWARTGDASELRDLEQKSMTSLSDPDGGYFVYPELDREINTILLESGGFRELATVRTTSTSEYKKRARTGGVDAGWVGEKDTRARTGTPQYDEIKIRTGELYARPAVTQTLLEDSAIDVESEIAEEVADAFLLLENDAFMNGDGSDDKPRGLLTYSTQANATSWGKFQHVVSGATTEIAGTNPGDELNKLIDLQHLLKTGYRGEATWIMNDATLAYLRKLRDADGRPFLTTDLSNGLASMLGKTINVVHEMPDMTSGSLAIGFGVWRRTYTILDRLGSTMERFYDSNTAPYVEFYTRKRVGGGVQQFETAKFMKFST